MKGIVAMDVFMFAFLLQFVGTVSFAISGAMAGLKKGMDVFGVSILGLTTAVGGGVLRDILLGNCPPTMFRTPVYALIAVVTSMIVFIPSVCKLLMINQRVYDVVMLLTDSVGLGIFTVYGVKATFDASGGNNLFLVVFLGAVTGVGGGVLRDVLTCSTPYIFVKHIYACAAIAGALVCAFLWDYAGSTCSMLSGIALIIIVRLLAAHFKWSLPKARESAGL